MQYSLLYDCILAGYLGKYRENLEKREETVYYNHVKEERKKLEQTFNSEQLKDIDSYIHSLTLFEEDINLFTSIKLLHIGIKIGMELQTSFDDYE